MKLLLPTNDALDRTDGEDSKVYVTIPEIGPFPALDLTLGDLRRLCDLGEVLHHRIVMAAAQIVMGESETEVAVLDSVTVSYLFKFDKNPMARVPDLNVRLLCGLGSRLTPSQYVIEHFSHLKWVVFPINEPLTRLDGGIHWTMGVLKLRKKKGYFSDSANPSNLDGTGELTDNFDRFVQVLSIERVSYVQILTMRLIVGL